MTLAELICSTIIIVFITICVTIILLFRVIQQEESQAKFNKYMKEMDELDKKVAPKKKNTKKKEEK